MKNAIYNSKENFKEIITKFAQKKKSDVKIEAVGQDLIEMKKNNTTKYALLNRSHVKFAHLTI